MRLDVENRLEEQHVVTTLWWAYSLVTNKMATTPCKTLCYVNTLLQHPSISKVAILTLVNLVLCRHMQ